jgi:anti-sigma B factor antagonist
MTRGESIYPSCSAATNDMKTDDNAVRITLDQQGEERCAKLAGSITIDSSPELRRALLRMLKTTGGRQFTLDFSEVVYIDSSGLAILIEVLRSARQLDKTVRLSGLRERSRYLIESTGVQRLFDEALTKK